MPLSACPGFARVVDHIYVNIKNGFEHTNKALDQAPVSGSSPAGIEEVVVTADGPTRYILMSFAGFDVKVDPAGELERLLQSAKNEVSQCSEDREFRLTSLHEIQGMQDSSL